MSARRFNAYIDGVGLNEIDPAVYIIDIREEAPKLDVQTGGNAKYDGLRLLSRAWSSRTVSITLAVREKDMARRAAIIDAVMDWVKDGQLTVNYRPDQQITVKYTDVPGMGSALKWADTIAIGFTAFDPYWRQSTPTIALGTTVANTALGLNIVPPGTVESVFLEFHITNISTSTMQTATIAVGGRSFALARLGRAPRAALAATDVANGVVGVKAGAASAMDKRSAQSADDLMLFCRRTNTVTITTQRACSVKLSARGAYK